MKSNTGIAVIFCTAGFLIGALMVVLICNEYLFRAYNTEYYTLNDIIYINRDGNVFHFSNENGGLDLTVKSITERDHVLSMLCDPADTAGEYFERLSTLQASIKGEPRKIIDQRTQ